jgi:hypothetical protein
MVLPLQKKTFVTLTSNVAPVCTGASGNLDEAISLTQEVPALSATSHQRCTQLDTFILRRTNCFPEERDSENFDQAYCRLLAFELLFLWNALPSCSVQHINNLLEGTALLHLFQTYNKHSTIHRYVRCGVSFLIIILSKFNTSCASR